MSNPLVMIVLASLTIQTSQQAAQAPQKPPDCTAAVHRQFDFWIGTWDVVPNGKAAPPGPPMTNVITSEYNGCVIVERWDGAALTGSSFNIYDRTRGQWHQAWVDSSGGLHHYWGGLRDGNMVFHGDTPLPQGARFAGRRTIRLTFFPMGPDKVRQLSEAYLPDGTWSVNYDLIYTRRKKTE